MVAHTRRALDLAIQFRKAIALDLVTVSAQDSYDVLKGTVQRAKRRLMEAEQASIEAANRLDKSIAPSAETIIKMNYVLSRQELDACKALIHMSGLSEPARETHDKDAARMSLAELEALIKDLKVIDNAAVTQHDDSAPIDIFS